MKAQKTTSDKRRSSLAKRTALGMNPCVPAAAGAESARPPTIRILVISPHPDDETIGCGGTLRMHVLAGHQVKVVFLTSGERGGHGRSPKATRLIREAEARRATALLGLAAIEFWREPDGGIPLDQRTVDRLRRLLSRWQPQRLYVPHPREMHADHRAAHRLVCLALAGRSANSGPTPEIYLYEVWTPLQQMDQIVDITRVMKTKLAAVRAYRSQCTVVGFDAAVQGLNRYRGELHSWPGGDYAEVFQRLPIPKARRSTQRARTTASRHQVQGGAAI